MLDQCLAEELRHVYERSGAKGLSLTKCFARGVGELRAACDHSAHFQILRWFFTQYPWKEIVLDQCFAEELGERKPKEGLKGFALTK